MRPPAQPPPRPFPVLPTSLLLLFWQPLGYRLRSPVTERVPGRLPRITPDILQIPGELVWKEKPWQQTRGDRESHQESTHVSI